MEFNDLLIIILGLLSLGTVFWSVFTFLNKINQKTDIMLFQKLQNSVRILEKEINEKATKQESEKITIEMNHIKQNMVTKIELVKMENELKNEIMKIENKLEKLPDVLSNLLLMKLKNNE